MTEEVAIRIAEGIERISKVGEGIIVFGFFSMCAIIVFLSMMLYKGGR